MISRLLLVMALAALPEFAAAAEQETWYAIRTEIGHKVGYAVQSERVKNGQTYVTHTQTLFPSPALSSPRRSVRKFTREVDKSGHTSRVTFSTSGAQTRNKITARIEGQTAEIKRKTRGGITRHTMALPENIRFDGGEPLIAKWDSAQDAALSFTQFNVASEAVQRVTVMPLPDTSPSVFVRKTYDGEALRAIALFQRGERGEISILTQPFLSTALIKTAMGENEAKAPRNPPKTRDVIGIASPYQMSEDALSGTIRYQFSFKHSVKFDIPNTSEQRAVTGEDVIYLEVCEQCGPDQTLSPAERERYLAPTPWIDSETPKISAAARRVRADNTNDDAVMTELGKWARRQVKGVDFAGHYSASDALKLGSGDCTEDAVLLAALGRAAGIPTRVASGLVYSRDRYHGVSHVFVSHSWTQAWVDGRWKSYDISMGSFDAGHIALALGDGDPALVAAGNSLSGFLELGMMAQIKPALP